MLFPMSRNPEEPVYNRIEAVEGYSDTLAYFVTNL